MFQHHFRNLPCLHIRRSSHLAAMNVESVRLNSEGRVRANSPAAQSKYARHVVRTGVPKAPQL